jgi:hypothetical protein
MKSDGLRAGIEHRIAELRAAYPRISACQAMLEDWHEGAEPRYSLRLDIRWPQHQSLVSGPACASADEAVDAAFELARRSLEPRHA